MSIAIPAPLSQEVLGPESMMTATRLAAVLGVHPNYVYDKAKNGDLPSFKMGGVRRFLWSEVLSWLETNRA